MDDRPGKTFLSHHGENDHTTFFDASKPIEPCQVWYHQRRMFSRRHRLEDDTHGPIVLISKFGLCVTFCALSELDGRNTNFSIRSAYPTIWLLKYFVEQNGLESYLSSTLAWTPRYQPMLFSLFSFFQNSSCVLLKHSLPKLKTWLIPSSCLHPTKSSVT